MRGLYYDRPQVSTKKLQKFRGQSKKLLLQTIGCQPIEFVDSTQAARSLLYFGAITRKPEFSSRHEALDGVLKTCCGICIGRYAVRYFLRENR